MRGTRKAPAPRDSLNFRRACLLSRNELESGTFTIALHANSSFTYVSVIYGANFPFKSTTSCSSDISFDAMIKFLLKRYLIDKIPLKEVFISDKKSFSVGSDSICMKLQGNKVDCFQYGAKWNKYLLFLSPIKSRW